MKKFERPRASTSSQTRRSANFGRKDQTPRKSNGLKPLNAAQLVSKVLDATTVEPSSVSVNDSTSESSEVYYENMNVHYMDDARNSENVCRFAVEMRKNDESLEDCEEGNDDESDSGTNRDSVSSSQGDFFAAEDKPSIVSKSQSSHDRPRTSKGHMDAESIRSRSDTFHGITPRKSTKLSKGQAKVTTTPISRKSTEYDKASTKSSQRSSEASDYKHFEEAKEDDIWEDAVNDSHTADSDIEAVVVMENKKSDVQQVLSQKIGTLEVRIEELEEELREVAALEMSLYSVFPKHGSSADKLHKPARHLFKLYMVARMSQIESKLITVSKNIVSGLFLVSKSCGTDVPRLIFWLSNIVVLREIISQTFGGKKVNGVKSLEEDWKDAGTLLAALRKLESCVFTWAVESIWSQVMMDHVKSQGVDAFVGRRVRKELRSALGSICVNVWEEAFEEALQRLCPIRAGGGKCGCLPVLTTMVMEQCVTRLDVAMFNAILRESAHQSPTDPVSDPIGDPRVLPIPAGVLSFESGVKLKNAVGYWSRLLMDIYDTDEVEDHARGEEDTFKPFKLLNELSDLLMLPKEMLVDGSTRVEVCPSVGLSLIKRILCNFTPDEFCPDPVPGTVLEELNSQSILEARSTGNPTTGFPRQAAPILYSPRSYARLTEMAAEFSRKLRSSLTRKNGYTSDEELEMKFPLEKSCFPCYSNRFRLINEVQLH